MKTIQLKQSVHKNEEQMTLEIAYDTELITLAKALPGIVWSQSRKSWHMNAKRKKDRIAPISD